MPIEIPTPTPVEAAAKSSTSAISNEASNYDDVTDNDPLDEGLVYLKAIWDKGFVPTEADYAYADKVREGKIKKSNNANIIKNSAFWLYMIFNFVLTVVNIFFK